MNKSKMILLMLAILIVVAGNMKAQDLIPEKEVNMKDVVYHNYYNLIYSNEKDIIAFQTQYDLFIINPETKDVLLKTKRLKDIAFFRKGESLIGSIDKSIKIFNMNSFLLTDSITFNEQIVLDFKLSRDQNKLCVLLKNGEDLYAGLKVIMMDINSKAIILEQIVNNVIDTTLSKSYNKFYYDNLDWNENLNYLSFEFTRRYREATPFYAPIHFTEIYSIDQQKILRTIEHSLLFEFDGLNNNTYYFTDYYDNDHPNILIANEINIISLETNSSSKTIFDFRPVIKNQTQNYLLFTITPLPMDKYEDKLVVFDKNNLTTKSLKMSYLHYEFNLTEDKTHLISFALGENRIAIYDISNITGVSAPNKEKILYPNPTNHLLNLDLDNTFDYNIQIIDETGKIVDSFPVSNTYQLNYDTSILPKGMYILQINSKMSSKSYKFMKE